MEPSISKEPISSRFLDSEQYQESSSSSFNQLESQSSPSQIVYNKDYVENLRRRFNNQQNEGRNVRNNEKLGCDTLHIHQRLKKHSHPCDLKTLTCLAGCCGRSFERIQVLAFHVSYAHQDFMTSVSGDLTCLLCGKKWTTVRRKIMHLSLAHREIGEEHNSQCMLQVESVIAPNAPKAQRLEKARLIYGDRIGDEYQDEFVEASAEVEEYSYDD